MAYKDTILTDGPILYTTFDEAGSTVADSSTAARTVTPAGSPVKAAGISGTALVFDGVNDTVAAAAVADHTSGSFTWECWFKSSQTTGTGHFIRRDGNGAAYLVRLNGGKVEFYANTTSILSPTVKADGQWHHVAAVKNGTATTLYIDGVSVATGTATSVQTGTTNLYLGSAGGTGEWYNGSLDEVAIYSKVLTSTQIQAHYNARVSPNISNVAPAMVVNVTSPAPVVTAVDITAPRTFAPIADWVKPNTNGGTATSGTMFGGASFKFAVDAAPTGYYIESAKLRLTRASGTLVPTYSIYHHLADWTEAASTSPGSIENTPHATGTIPAGSPFDVDVTGTVRNLTSYGFLVSTSNDVFIATRENATVASRPSLIVQYALIPQVPAVSTVTGPMVLNLSSPQHRAGTGVKSAVIGSASASITAPAPVVSGRKNKVVQAPATTFTLQFPGGQSRNPDQRVNAGYMEMWLFSPNPTQYISVDLKNAAPSMQVTLSGTSDNDINLQTDKRVFITTPMSTKINMVGVYRREADRYLSIVPTTLDADDKWYQMEETSGTTAIDATFDFSSPGVENNRANATYVGGPTFGVEGPKLRKAVHFDGVDDHMVLPTQAWNIFDFTVEFSIRTTQQNGTIYRGGAPRSTPTAGTTPAVDTMDGLVIRNGELMLQIAWTDPANPLIYRTGKQVADGEWHHIVLSAPNPGATQGMFAFGISQSRQTFIMVDGTVEFARYIDFSGAHPAMPYKVMGRFNSTGPSDALNGDLRDFIVRTNYSVSQGTASRLYYEWSETTLVKAEPMVLDLSMPDPFTAKGNTKRMIVLYGLPYALQDESSGSPTIRDGWGNYISVFANYYIQTNNGDITGPTGEIPNGAGYPVPIYNNPRMVFFNVRPFRLENFICYPVAIATTPGSDGAKSASGMEKESARDLLTGQLLDNKTGLPRFIDLQNDLREDITAYDAITVMNYPAAQAEENNVSSDPVREFRQHNLGLNSNEWNIARDRLRDSILQALYDGVSLWGNEPHMAQHLGFIQAWDKHATGARYEFFGPGGIDATGLTNYRAMELDAQHFANGVFTLPPAGTRLTTDYNPTWQANAKRQIVNLEPGLTDLPGWETKERIKIQKANAWEPHAQVVAWDIVDRMAGLQVGDQLVMEMWEQNEPTGNYPGIMASWSVGIPRRYIVSARPEGIVGKVISKEMDSYYVSRGAVQVNPWRNNVYTIAAERGSVVRGRPIAGRAFFDFMDTEITKIKVFEDRNKDTWNGEAPVDGLNQPKSRWSFDSRRYRQVIITTLLQKELTRGPTEVVKVTTEERYIELQEPNVIYRPFMSMNARGLNWLAKADSVPAGTVRVSTTAMQLNLSAGDATVKRTLNNTVVVTGTMRLDIDLRQPRNFRGNNASEKALPMVLSLSMNGLGKAIKADPMVLNLEAVDANATGSGDKIYVYMDAERNVTLYIKEE